jgi:Fe-S-cluster containining protein
MEERLSRVRERFARVEVEVGAFAAASQLACPAGCGACCNSPDVEASTVELHPMAEALLAAGRGEAVLAALHDASQPGSHAGSNSGPKPAPCVLYVPDPSDPRRGRCSMYAERPLVCRLFGFGARRERTGRARLVVCSTMRAADPVHVTAVAENEVLAALAPVMADHAHAVSAEFPGDEGRLRPINEALREALERALLRARFEEQADAGGRGEDDEPRDDGSGPEPPLVAA